jgi:hypothetical protein
MRLSSGMVRREHILKSKRGRWINVGLRWTNSLRVAVTVFGCALLAGCCSPARRPANQSLLWPQDQGATIAGSDSGPTLRLDYDQGGASSIPIDVFMYFIPLISSEPVTVTRTPGNTQRAHVTSVARQFSEESFSVVCEFDFAGEGRLVNVFDHSESIRRQEWELKEGSSLKRRLDSISVEGAGSGILEVEGTITNHVPTVSEVRLRFDADGQSSPIGIGIHDIEYHAGEYRSANEMVARVNALAFRREPGRPKMYVTVASVNRKDGGSGLWQNLVGAVKGMAVNLVIKPIAVEADGHTAMLNLGLALAAAKPTFTFPKARNIIAAKARGPRILVRP